MSRREAAAHRCLLEGVDGRSRLALPPLSALLQRFGLCTREMRRQSHPCAIPEHGGTAGTYKAKSEDTDRPFPFSKVTMLDAADC